jgi:GNAT superfamily N-acetyltransferase
VGTPAIRLLDSSLGVSPRFYAGLVNAGDCTITSDLSREERDLLLQRLSGYGVEATGGGLLSPNLDISVAVESPTGEVVGGTSVSSRLSVMFPEVLWVADDHRGLGLGEAVVREAERQAREAGCGASQTWTFSFQAPGFYEKIGYQRIGFFDGYPGRITECILAKPFEDSEEQATPLPRGYQLIRHATPEHMEPVLTGFHEFCVAQVGDAMEGIAIDLALRLGDGTLVGGLHAWTTLQVMVPGRVWVEPELRGCGHGSRFLENAERVAREHGCISVQTAAFDFQSPGFFWRNGYENYGQSSAYPAPFREHYLIKRLT